MSARKSCSSPERAAMSSRSRFSCMRVRDCRLSDSHNCCRNYPVQWHFASNKLFLEGPLISVGAALRTETPGMSWGADPVVVCITPESHAAAGVALIQRAIEVESGADQAQV